MVKLIATTRKQFEILLYWVLVATEASSLFPPVIKNSMNVRNSSEETELAVQHLHEYH